MARFSGVHMRRTRAASKLRRQARRVARLFQESKNMRKVRDLQRWRFFICAELFPVLPRRNGMSPITFLQKRIMVPAR